MNHKILFICTGNYYRSRYAEMFFNASASRLNLGWSAFSRGLAIELNYRNIGPIYPRVLGRLKDHAILIEIDIRSPVQLAEMDLEEADLVIALNEREHLPWMRQRFQAWANRITYWQVADLDQLGSEEAFSIIEGNVTHLISQLSLNKEDQLN